MLTFSFVHSGKWPQAVRANGHLLLNSEKVRNIHLDVQWGKKVDESVREMREVCNFHRSYTSTVREKKNPGNHRIYLYNGAERNFFCPPIYILICSNIRINIPLSSSG